jgi:hypothetical protein
MFVLPSCHHCVLHRFTYRAINAEKPPHTLKLFISIIFQHMRNAKLTYKYKSSHDFLPTALIDSLNFVRHHVFADDEILYKMALCGLVGLERLERPWERVRVVRCTSMVDGGKEVLKLRLLIHLRLNSDVISWYRLFLFRLGVEQAINVLYNLI